MPRTRLLAALTCLLLVGIGSTPRTTAAAEADAGILPAAKDGHPLNFDFETGDLRDWRTEGKAFSRSPVEGDAVASRRPDMKSRHTGKFWASSFEGHGDEPRGTLISVPFTLTRPYARFLMAGGARSTTRFEIVRDDTKQVIYKTNGDDTEEMKPVVADLKAHLGKDIFLRLIDDDSAGWGHLNFDDFTLWSTRPAVPPRAGDAAPDLFEHAGLSPEDAAKAMTVPKGFDVTLFAGEPDVVQPIAFTIDDRGRLWVAEAYSYPSRVADSDAKDRILIFEDTNRDGRFDTRKVFAEKLNLVSGIEVGFGGVWVGAAPQFLFIPDADKDDRPDGPAQILLDGWGAHDTHETLNSFNWGPDGWLYGCHGVFTHSNVGKPGTPAKDRTPINAGIWRYHPTRRTFEVFAHGTSNPWGVDFDADGRAFLTSCVIPHLYNVIQNARYERQAGPHFNPYTYDDIKTIADHRHYVGANPHAGNGRSDQAGGGHAHAGALIYNGGLWPADYQGSILMNNIHGARLNRDTFEPKGSGFVGHHAPDFLLANDLWSQVVSLKPDPDGNVFMIDWYDKNQCHRNEREMHDRTNGRIFKIRYQPEKAVASQPFPDDPASLITRLASPNQFQSSHARRRLQELAGTLTDAHKQSLRALAFGDKDEPTRLHALWTLHAVSALDDATLLKAASDSQPMHRAWSIQLACEDGSASPSLLARFAEMAAKDPSPVVRLYLASALPRLPVADRWSILEPLVLHSEDANDPNLPLMDWYAAEPLAAVDPARALKLARSSPLPNLLPFMVRRISADGRPESIALLVSSLKANPTSPHALAIVSGLVEALKGRRKVDMPAAWPGVYASLQKRNDPRLQSLSTALALTFGDPAALKSLRLVLADASAKLETRREALTALLKAKDPALAAELIKLLDEPALRAEAIRGLASYDDPSIGPAILHAYKSATPAERRDALNTLAARLDTSRALLAAVESGAIASKDLSADVIRQLRNHKDADLEKRIGQAWGRIRETSSDRAQAIARYRSMLTSKPKVAPDVELGRAMYAKTCQQCHTLFGAGGKVGPELTGSNRADLDYILSNVLDPSSLIGKDYLAHVVATTDGRILTGLIRGEDKDALTIQTANEVVVLPLAEIEQRRPSDQSMMPEDLWSPLSEHEVRSLVAYLASPRQVPMRATPENVAGFFNGKDLAGWQGDPKLWRVENGELIGQTAGLSHNRFLTSDLSVADFRLTFEVKLVANRGNSGLQFRSELLPDGEMKGYQADIGPGWWGKLYEENGRALLWDKSGESHVKPGEWNTYEVVASGPSTRTFINGHPCVVLDDPKGARRGIFGLQLHSGEATEVHYRNLKLELDPKLDPKSR